MPPNNTNGLAGRFCNHLIRNLYVSFLAERNGHAINYSYKTEIDRLGIPLYSGTKTFPTTIIIRDEDNVRYLDTEVLHNLFVDWTSAQNHTIASRIYDYFRRPEIRAMLMAANAYKDRFGANNDVFVHIRLDDAAVWSPGYVYYDEALKALNASSGFVSSDSPNHPFVTALLEKYKLTLVDKPEVETLMLAATCKHLVLSYGTFSWSMGALALDPDTTVFYPPKQYSKWCGDIFAMPGWKIFDPPC